MDGASSSSSDWDYAPRYSVTEVLNIMAAELTPSEDYAQRCQDITLQVVNILELEMISVTGHVMVAGSFGKGTAISNDSDYDIVIFFNELQPPFGKVLNFLETVLKENMDQFKGFRWGFRSSIHISFEVEGIRFDLTPAAQLDNNFPWSRWCCFAPSMLTPYPSRQYSNTLKKIAELKDPEKQSYLYSSSLSIDAVIFVQRQGPFIHATIRLAKYWVKHVNIGRVHVHGKSLLMETLAIHACYGLKPLEMSEGNLRKAFLKVMEFLINANDLRLYIYVNYLRKDIPDSIFYQTPLVLDPANPYNNLLNPFHCPPLALKCFQEAAQVTVRKINIWKDGDGENIDEFRNIMKCDGHTSKYKFELENYKPPPKPSTSDTLYTSDQHSLERGAD